MAGIVSIAFVFVWAAKAARATHGEILLYLTGAIIGRWTLGWDWRRQADYYYGSIMMVFYYLSVLNDSADSLHLSDPVRSILLLDVYSPLAVDSVATLTSTKAKARGFATVTSR